MNKKEISFTRDLAKRYMEALSQQQSGKTKDLWRKLHNCKMDRPMIYVWAILFTDELEEIAQPFCQDPLLLEIEKRLQIDLYHFSIGDDYLLEPYINTYAEHTSMENGPWGVLRKIVESKGGAYKAYAEAPVKSFDDLSIINPPGHFIDEKKTAEKLSRLQDVLGDILEVQIIRSPHYDGNFPSRMPDMRGLSQVMMDMVDNPEGLHRMLLKMQTAAINAMDKADAAGDYTSTDSFIQSCSYCDYALDPYPIKKANRKDLWCYAQAQELTLVSPSMHKEFALDYQKPIMEKFAASAYGCCEDLTHKIDMLRKIKNLKQISIAPAANLEKCAEQIRSDYVISWRPNPTDQVCVEFDPPRIRRLIREGCDILNKYGCHYEINLKDVVSIQRERGRMKEWVEIVRSIIA